MNRKQANTVALVVGLAAMVLPVLLAFRVAHDLSLDTVGSQALAMSKELFRRAEATSDQGTAAIDVLVAANSPDACSDANIALMRASDVASSYLQSVGAVSNGRLKCSSLGRHGEGFALGPVAYVSSKGTRVRPSVQLPIAQGIRMLVLEKSGYAVLVHQNLAIDVFNDQPDVALGAFSQSSNARITGRGVFDPAWASAARKSGQAVLFDGGHVVAIQWSKKYDYATFAAVPAHYVSEGANKIAGSLVPIGAMVGVLFLIPIMLLARRHTSLPGMLRNGLKLKQFFLQYQPVVDLATGRCVGAEAVIRWQRPDGTFVRPDLFIPVAEECGLIRKVSSRVMELLRQDAPAILAAHPDLMLSFNLSPEDLQSRHILEELKLLLDTTNVLPANVHVEMTERGILDTDHVRGIVNAIRDMGIRVAIDDFGTGFSSLSYLTTFEVDYLKIDKAFVDTLGTAAATSQVAMHIITMAKELNLTTIAEGVETQLQATILRDAGVQYGQGWLYARAMGPSALCDFVTASRLPRKPGVHGSAHANGEAGPALAT